MYRGLILTVGGKPAISNLCAIMIPDGADINDVYIDYRYVGPGSIAFTTSNDKQWRLGANLEWTQMVNSGGGGSAGGYDTAIYDMSMYGQ